MLVSRVVSTLSKVVTTVTLLSTHEAPSRV